MPFIYTDRIQELLQAPDRLRQKWDKIFDQQCCCRTSDENKEPPIVVKAEVVREAIALPESEE